MDWTSLNTLDHNMFLHLNGSENEWLDGVMWTITQTQTWIPLLFALIIVVTKTGGWKQLLFFSVFFGLSILLADQISSSYLKPLFQRLRPTHDPTIMHLVDTVHGYTGGQYGFVSSHAANTFAVFAFCALALRSLSLSITLFLWAVVDSYSRIYLGVHFPGDILCGSILGLICGLASYSMYWFLYGRNVVCKHKKDSNYTSTGFHVIDIRFILLIFILTVIFVCIRAFAFK